MKVTEQELRILLKMEKHPQKKRMLMQDLALVQLIKRGEARARQTLGNQIKEFENENQS